MEVRSIYKFARISPLKARDVAREIQGLPVSQAIDVLTFTPRKAAQLINKTLKSAVANAENNHELDVDALVVKEATVTKGPAFRRFKARARGSASAIQKPTSHIRIVVTDEIALPEPKQKKGGKKRRRVEKAAPAAAAVTEEPAAAAEEAPPTEASVPAGEPAGSGGADMGLTRLDERLGVVFETPPAVADDLKQIGGVGDILEGKLNEAGVYTFRQIAQWDDGNIAAFDELLALGGRIERDGWIEQANTLQAGQQGDGE